MEDISSLIWSSFRARERESSGEPTSFPWVGRATGGKELQACAIDITLQYLLVVVLGQDAGLQYAEV